MANGNPPVTTGAVLQRPPQPQTQTGPVRATGVQAPQSPDVVLQGAMAGPQAAPLVAAPAAPAAGTAPTLNEMAARTEGLMANRPAQPPVTSLTPDQLQTLEDIKLVRELGRADVGAPAPPPQVAQQAPPPVPQIAPPPTPPPVPQQPFLASMEELAGRAPTPMPSSSADPSGYLKGLFGAGRRREV